MNGVKGGNGSWCFFVFCTCLSVNLPLFAGDVRVTALHVSVVICVRFFLYLCSSMIVCV